MLTNIYHITYAPSTKAASLFFWGCNLNCKGCYCQRRVFSSMLGDCVGYNLQQPKMAIPPTQFLTYDQVMEILSRVELEEVTFEGQEASTFPFYGHLSEEISKRFASRNLLLTNGYELPDLRSTHKIGFGLKAVSDEIHRDYTGVSNARIIENLRKLYRSGKDLVIESVFIPGYIDLEETERIAEFISGIDKNLLYIILPYFQAGNNLWKRPTPDQMEQATNIAKRHLNRVLAFTGEEQLKYEVVSLFPDPVINEYLEDG
ncbi:radical SAM protein [Dehalogenimonas etheniformans]|uniref:Radical SAM protein n=1 Tax=Dehalogenimonas etheniformans TaxID=1536648 RepID=A0A2P5PA81_9CHLR|nr:radical SAM protein [Dehalogenimonas etheniformans]PPD59184.1 radical SAM protein [Dehalogenimonas etheniformans]